jgi:WD40 repeat protein
MEKTGGGAFLGGLWCLADGKARLLDTTYARMAIFDPVTAHVQSIVQFEGMKLRGEKVATDFALSGDGQILVGPPANLSGPLTVWNATTGKKLNEFTSIPGRITAAACNADGTRAAFSTVTIENHRVTRRDFVIVNPRTGEILRHEQTQGFGYPALAFNAAGDMLYMGLYSHTASDNGLRMLDLRTYETFDLPFERKTMVRNLGLSHDGRLLAAMDYADDDDGQKIWMIDLEERKILWKQNHVGPVTGFAFSPNGRRLAAARYDQVIILYDSQTGEEAFVKRIPGMRPGDYAYPARAAFSPDGRSLMMSQFWSRISIWRTDRWNATPKEAFAERRAEAAASAEAFHLRGLRDAITTDPDSPALRPHREWFERQKQMNK